MTLPSTSSISYCSTLKSSLQTPSVFWINCISSLVTASSWNSLNSLVTSLTFWLRASTPVSYWRLSWSYWSNTLSLESKLSIWSWTSFRTFSWTYFSAAWPRKEPDFLRSSTGICFLTFWRDYWSSKIESFCSSSCIWMFSRPRTWVVWRGI